jgi:hypothetical protein
MSRREDDRKSEHIREEIDRTRARMDSTVGELEERLRPSNLMDEAWQKINARERGREALDFVRNNPIPLAVVGAGIGWLAIRNARRGRRDESADFGSARSRGSYAYESGAPAGSGDYGTGFRSPGSHESGYSPESSWRESWDEPGSPLRPEWAEGGRLGRLKGKARRGLHRSGERFNSAVDEWPLGMTFAAFALGTAIGLSLPPSRPENRLLGRAGDRARDEARRAGRQMVEKGRRVAASAAEAAKEEADRQGITPVRLKEKARQVADVA